VKSDHCPSSSYLSSCLQQALLGAALSCLSDIEIACQHVFFSGSPQPDLPRLCCRPTPRKFIYRILTQVAVPENHRWNCPDSCDDISGNGSFAWTSTNVLTSLARSGDRLLAYRISYHMPFQDIDSNCHLSRGSLPSFAWHHCSTRETPSRSATRPIESLCRHLSLEIPLTLPNSMREHYRPHLRQARCRRELHQRHHDLI
jgi:hypothetical protein